MDISQLQYFIVVAREEHMTKASEILNLSQSALSRSITALERELGLSLFDRQKRSIQLNKYGREFYKEAQKIVKQLEHTKVNLSKLEENEPVDQLSITFIHSLGLNYIPSLLRDFQKTGVPCKVELHESRAEAASNRLLHEKTDFVFGTEYDLFTDLNYIPLFTEKIVLICAAEHRFSRMDIVSLEEISKEEFIHYHLHTSLRRLIDKAFLEYNLDMNIAYEGIEINSIIGLVSANMGIALVPESAVQNFTNVHVVPTKNLHLERTIYFMHHRNKTFKETDAAFKQFTMAYHKRFLNSYTVKDSNTI